MTDEPEWSARLVYKEHITQLSVQEASVAVPLIAVERSLQRHKVSNRPVLPVTRRELVLQIPHTTTTDGRTFVLVDDGLDDRILVFGTTDQLRR